MSMGPAPPAREPWRSRGDVSNPPGRFAILDAGRGAALAGMVAYHLAWDLHALGLADTDPGAGFGWPLLGRIVAGAFLALSGIGLSLAARRGTARGMAARRLGRIAAAAALVSVATRAVAPETPIWFGILHCIAVTNAIALVLRPLPSLALLAAAAASAVAPAMLGGIVGPGWAWTGLAATEPATLDFRPVLPWLAPVLFGMTFGRLWTTERRRPSGARPVRALAWVGRHSLAIYLVHQPLMLATLLIVGGAAPGPDPTIASLRQPAQAAAFLMQCRDTCVAQGETAELCVATCHCTLTGLVARSPRRRWFAPRASTPDIGPTVAACRNAVGTGAN